MAVSHDVADGLDRLQTLADLRINIDQRRNLSHQRGEVGLIQNNLANRNFAFNCQIRSKGKTDHLEGLEYNPVDCTEECIDQIQIVTAVYDPVQVGIHLADFHFLQTMCPRHRNHFKHFGNCTLRVFHLASKFLVFLPNRLFKCPHGQNCKGYDHKEKQKYHRTFPQGNDNDHGNIQDKEKQGSENLVQKLRNIFHVSHDL